MSASTAAAGTRSHKKLFVILLVVFGIGFFVVMIVGAGALFILTSKELPVTAADRAVVLDVNRVAGYMDGFEPVEAAGTITKTRYFDGSHDLDYEYNHPHLDDALYVGCSITIERKVSDALASYGAVKFGLTLGFKLEGGDITEKAANHLLRWGDQSSCSILMNKDKPVGNILVVRKDRRVMAITISGVYFDDPDTFGSLVLPVLERFESYDP